MTNIKTNVRNMVDAIFVTNVFGDLKVSIICGRMILPSFLKGYSFMLQTEDITQMRHVKCF